MPARGRIGRRTAIVAAAVVVLVVATTGTAFALASSGAFSGFWNVCGHVATKDDPSVTDEYTTRCAAPFATTPAAAPSGRGGTLVVLGDSFTAGEGAPQVLSVDERTYWGVNDAYIDGTDDTGNRCHRSPMAYGWQLAKREGLRLDFRACSGATSADLTSGQGNRKAADGTPIPAQLADPFPADTTAVVIGMGGNDVGFADLVQTCILNGASRLFRAEHPLLATAIDRHFDCAKSAAAGRACIPEMLGATADRSTACADRSRHDLPAALRRAQEAPHASRVILTSYPRMFPAAPVAACGMGSGTGSTISVASQKALNAFVDAVDDRLAAIARTSNVDFVDMRAAFEGHGLCVDQGPDADPATPERWVNRLHIGRPVNPGSANLRADPSIVFPDLKETSHPNTAGQAAYTRAVTRCFEQRSACVGGGGAAAPFAARQASACPASTIDGEPVAAAEAVASLTPFSPILPPPSSVVGFAGPDLARRTVVGWGSPDATCTIRVGPDQVTDLLVEDDRATFFASYGHVDGLPLACPVVPIARELRRGSACTDARNDVLGLVEDLDASRTRVVVIHDAAADPDLSGHLRPGDRWRIGVMVVLPHVGAGTGYLPVSWATCSTSSSPAVCAANLSGFAERAALYWDRPPLSDGFAFSTTPVSRPDVQAAVERAFDLYG